MNEPTTTIVGNITADPELRYTQAGQPVANFTVASTPRQFDRDSGEWTDGDTLFLRCTAWGDLAENLAQLTKGTRVLAQGRLTQNNYQDREGNNRSSVEMQVDDAGPSLRWATADVHRTTGNDAAPDDAAPEQPAARGRQQGRTQTRGRQQSRR